MRRSSDGVVVQRAEESSNFLGFRDTALYVTGLCKSEGWATDILVGGMTAESRVDALQHFTHDGQLLVLTTGASAGLDLRGVKKCVHYDCPWNPGQVWQRLGRIHRLGAPAGDVNHFFFADDLLIPASSLERLARLEEIPADDFAILDKILVKESKT